MRYLIPNVVDIHDDIHCERERLKRKYPTVGYAPSNWNAKGWDNKGFGLVHPYLKRRQTLSRDIRYTLIAKKPFTAAMEMKRQCDMGIDEFMTGSYHLSSMEFLSMGIATVAHLDELTRKAVFDVTGAENLPWIDVTKNNFSHKLDRAMTDMAFLEEKGKESRKWMERHWAPENLTQHYVQMYEDLLLPSKK